MLVEVLHVFTRLDKPNEHTQNFIWGFQLLEFLFIIIKKTAAVELENNQAHCYVC